MLATQLVILELLDQHGMLRGLELVERSGGKISRGTVYPHLSQLIDGGYVEECLDVSDPHADQLPRRLYRITGSGRRAVSVAEASLGDLFGGPALQG